MGKKDKISQNIIDMVKTDQEIKEIAEIEDFLKTAFCIDGTCEMKNFPLTEKIFFTDVYFKLVDKKRGTFFIVISREEPQTEK